VTIVNNINDCITPYIGRQVLLHENIGYHFFVLFIKYGFCYHDRSDGWNKTFKIFKKYDKPFLGHDSTGIHYHICLAVHDVRFTHCFFLQAKKISARFSALLYGDQINPLRGKKIIRWIKSIWNYLRGTLL
jgi:hypothetical protein